jgi:NAD-dependent SIR2 family protein deacetylase
MNQDNISELLNAIALGKDKLVIFAGAGVCKMTGIPLWEGLFEKLEKFLEVKILDANIKDPAEKAQKLYDFYEDRFKDKGQQFWKKFKESLEATEWDYSPSQINILHVCKHIVTTNYDKTFEYAFEDYSRFSGQEMPPKKQMLPLFDFTDFIMQKRCIIFLHGHITGDEFIFTKKEYDRYYKENSPVIEFCKTLYCGNQLLFIGCGFEDEYVLNMFEKIYSDKMKQKEEYNCRNDIQHYAFVRDKKYSYEIDIEKEMENPPSSGRKSRIDKIEENKKAFNDKVSKLEKCGIKCLLYNNHKDYRKWLNTLKERIDALPAPAKNVNDFISYPQESNSYKNYDKENGINI